MPQRIAKDLNDICQSAIKRFKDLEAFHKQCTEALENEVGEIERRTEKNNRREVEAQIDDAKEQIEAAYDRTIGNRIEQAQAQSSCS